MQNYYPVPPIIPSGRMALLKRSADARALKSPAHQLWEQVREILDMVFGATR